MSTMSMDPTHPRRLRLPDTCGIAFKEWAGICDALAEGRQALIVRKGGIAEGPRGFVPEHDIFWLYPTFVHEAEQGLRAPVPTSQHNPAAAATVPLRVLAAVDSVAFVDREETLAALADLHVWTPETVARRFHYRKPGLWVLGVRAYRRPDHDPEPPQHLAVTAEHAGCRSWVPIDPPLSTGGYVPVLDEAEFARRRARLLAALG